MRIVFAGLCVAMALVLVGMQDADGGDKKEPKNSIKDVMKKAHKDGLLKKVSGGKASADEVKELVALYEDLAANKPGKGEADSWKALTSKIVECAKAVQKGDEDAPKKLAAATNCAGCHKLHK